MAETKFNAKDTIRIIERDHLLEEAMIMKSQGQRLSQACASYKDGKYELSYSFSDDETLSYTTLRVYVGLTETVPSLNDLYPYASFYENEMKELFGVKIALINPDYHDKFYRIKAVAPFLPEDAKAEQAKEEAEASSAADANSVQETESGEDTAEGKNAAPDDDVQALERAAERSGRKDSV